MGLYTHKNVTLSLFWLLWIACLVSYIVYNLFFYLLLAPTLFLIFILIKIMFKKKTNSNNEVFPVTNIPHKAHSPLTDLSPDTTKTNTIIAAGTQLTGDVRLDGDIQIYGVVVGDIIVSDGTIRLMRSGKIEGNLTAPHITVDGRIEGICVSDHLEILENGRLNGIVKGSNFSIKKGGVFIGQSEITEEPDSQSKGKVKPAVIVPQEKANTEEARSDAISSSK
ncbi:bactofilin family protein [Yersinia sp. 2553 StPb PI]|uniref:bactofilin family protein n=1 Tax=Yersinia sp. 2553 StPb PI TaxID=3117411 RepID=UPI0009F66A76